ncbi:carboxypeptidase regulatory-like domain-containing protein [Neolewinella antarctica]|uniref:Outer membrane receptor protein involved in Fe transport n=1 Tax=Neolewinella antarctica TaxID=442734 RepID=A0ABX0X7G4_9BACT|nr:carboxypeptidase regulatory-like domain-containing protein [Neolewinella antarctica]NJC25087.1 outer membrane receptor protein involved in Fe transport [Neolewinella antarctica]
MKRNLLLFVLLLVAATAFAQTALKGEITDNDTGEPLLFATIQLLKNGAFYQGTQTDLEGNYYISNIDPGTYELRVDYTGYPVTKLTGVVILQGKTNTVNVAPSSAGGVLLDQIVVSEYRVPLVEQDNTTQGQTITAEQIRNLPTRNINQIASTVAGASSTDEGSAINIRGSRSNATDYYVDGVRVGSVSIPDSEIEQLQVVTGGIEARYGDVTGGIISITTKGFSDKFTVTAEGETSEGLDNFGNSLGGVAISGPLLRDKQQKAVLGYRLSGRYTYRADDDPSAVPLFLAKDEVRQGLEADPLTTINGRPFVAADFLDNDDVNALKTRPFEAQSILNLNAKITARLSDAIDIQLSGAYGDNENQFTPGENGRASWRLLNAYRNPTQNRENIRGNLMFRHRLGGAGVAGGDGTSSNLIQNANYDLQFTYENVQSDVQDAIHQGNYFDYGYVGNLDRAFIPIFDPVFNEDLGAIEFNHIDYREVLRGYTAENSTNPILNNFNNYLFRDELIGFTDQEFAIRNEPNRSSTVDNFIAINGNTQNIYRDSWGFHANVGAVYSLYQIADNDRFTFQANANFDVIPGNDPRKSRHGIQLGVMYEQRTDRAYTLNPTSLWTIARQLSNSPLETVTPDNRVVDSLSVGGQNSAVYAPTVSNQDGRFFTQIRERLGVPQDAFVNTDGLNPADLSLNLFSADELAGANLLDYYGYDYLGNEFNGSFDDFFDRDPVTGERSFLVAPNRPIYAAAYLQDKFTINDMIFRLGVRVDRYDANTRVLKDPYSLYEIQGAGSFHATAGTTRPGTIGEDYAVYLTESGGDEIQAYRNGDDWFFADGNPANGFQEIDGIRDLLVFPSYANPEVDRSNGNLIKQDEFTVETSFKDYEVQFNVMPRLSFSFPISEDANFFAHYDVLVQRPPSNTITTALDYFYFTDRANNATFNNSALRPERTIDYEVGFKTILTSNSALSISAYYKELRDMIQLRTFVPVPIVGQYTTYDNQDFATVKGFSLSYDLRRIYNFTVNANYTLQFADGTGSNSTSQRGLGNRGNLRNLFPLSFDERHRVNLVLDYRLGQQPTVPKLLHNFGANLQATAVSGRPYTGTFVPGELGGSGTRGALNGSRKPANITLNGQVSKDITFGNGSRMNVYFRISNLTDRRNVLNVYSVTGSADDPGFLQSTFGRDQLRNISEGSRSVGAYQASYQWKILNPDFFTLPRRMFVGAIFSL